MRRCEYLSSLLLLSSLQVCRFDDIRANGLMKVLLFEDFKVTTYSLTGFQDQRKPQFTLGKDRLTEVFIEPEQQDDGQTTSLLFVHLLDPKIKDVGVYIKATFDEIHPAGSDFLELQPCIKTLVKLPSRKSQNTKDCIKINLKPVVPSESFIQSYQSVDRPPLIFSKEERLLNPLSNHTLLIGDEIICRYPDKISPKPSLYWIFDNKPNSLEEVSDLSDSISLFVDRMVSPGYYNIRCLAVNVLLGIRFMRWSNATVFVIQPPQALVIQPNKSFFFEHEVITCTVEGANDGCEWIHVLGPSLLKKTATGSSCRLNVSALNSWRLTGGFYEYTCMGRGKRNHGNLFQRKIFHVFVPLTIPPVCPACDADAGKDGYFVCENRDPYNYPKAFIQWRLLSGDPNQIFIRRHEFLVPPKDAQQVEEEVVFQVVCLATDRLKRQNNDRWGNLTSPIYGVRGNSIVCALNLNSVIQLVVLYVILIAFLVVDIFLCIFINASRYLSSND